MINPKVGVVTVNWNNFTDTKECLNSLQKLIYPNVEIIVVDNNSQDNSLKSLKNEFSGIEFVSSDQNLGYAGGLNQGIKLALENNCQYVLILNNDTIVSPGLLQPMVEFGEQNEKAGVLGGKIYFLDEPARIWSLGGHVSLFKAGGKYIGADELDEGQYNEITEISLVSGCMMLIKAEVFARVGLLNEGIFFRGEEWEFCWRVRKARFKLFYIPEGVIWHKENRSHNRFEPRYIYSAYVAKQLFAREYMPKFIHGLWRTVFHIYAIFFAINKFKKIAEKKGQAIDRDKLRRAIELAFMDGATKTKLTEFDLNRCEEFIQQSEKSA